jgi:hypothetical protein
MTHHASNQARAVALVILLLLIGRANIHAQTNVW